jgi:DNA-binding MarR family transcriptional regulator
VASGEITDDVKRFIHDHIHSVEQLEVLLLLAGSGRQEWDAAAVSQKLYIQAASAETRLADLQARGFLTVRMDGPHKRYSFASLSAAQEQTIRGLDAAYKMRKDSVINLIFSRPADNIRSFSDAFRIRRQD